MNEVTYLVLLYIVKTLPQVDKDGITSIALDLYLQIVENIFIEW